MIKKVLMLTAVALVAWMVTVQVPRLFVHQPEHEAVIENRSGRTIETLAFAAGRRTFAADSVRAGARVRFAFTVRDDTPLSARWTFAGANAPLPWNGGVARRGPIPLRHRLTIDRDGGVVYVASPRSPGVSTKR